MKTTTLLSSLSLYLRRQKKKEKSVKRKVKNAKNLSLRKLTGRMTSKSQFTMHL